MNEMEKWIDGWRGFVLAPQVCLQPRTRPARPAHCASHTQAQTRAVILFMDRHASLLWAGVQAARADSTSAVAMAAGTGAALALRSCGGGASTSYGEGLVFESVGTHSSPRLSRLARPRRRAAPFASVTSASSGGPQTVSLPVIPLASATAATRPFWRRGGQAQFVSLPIGVGNGERERENERRVNWLAFSYHFSTSSLPSYFSP